MEFSDLIMKFNLFVFAVTPFDVVKIRLQTQQKTQLSNKCFLYCNGLMDHLCPCINPNGPGQPSQASQAWYHRTGHFTGTVVSRTSSL
jgi:solute carrier family 25 protein 39/40